MDRFKVRMYDKNIQKMYSFENDCMLEATFECLKQQLAFESGLKTLKPISYNHIEDGRVFMQCSGKKDLNERLIYEGDILKTTHIDFEGEKTERIGFVAKEEGSFIVNEARCKYDLYQYDMIYEVIGNIHQNMELLCK